VPAGHVSAHLAGLEAVGWSRRRIASAAGVAPATLTRLADRVDVSEQSNGCRGRARCRTVSAFLDLPHDQVAVSICRSCPVRPQCLAEAVEVEDVRFVIRGGLLPRQRHWLRSPTI